MATTGNLWSKSNSVGTSTGEKWVEACPISTLNSALNNTSYVPSNAEITNVKLHVKADFDLGMILGNVYFRYGWGGTSNINKELMGSSKMTSTNELEYPSGGVDITSYLSSKTSPFAISTSNGSYLAFAFSSSNITSKTYKVTSVTLEITYKIPTYTITWKNYDGTVLETDTGVARGATPTYNGATPTKASTDRNDFAFSGWSPSVASVTGNATYTAQFDVSKVRYKLTTKCEPEGVAVTEGDGFYSANTTVSISAIVGDDYDRWGWAGWKNTRNDNISDYIVNYKFIMPAEDVTYTAMFKEIPMNIRVSCIESYGTVTGGGEYMYGSTVTLTATANTGFKFVGWSDGETSPTRTITVTRDANYYANFERLKYTITFKDGDGSILEVVETEYQYRPQWSKTPTKESTAEYTYNFTGSWIPALTGATQDQTYEPYFDAVKRSYTITANSNNNDYGFVSGGGTYEYGTKVTLVATPSSGYRFVKWTDGDTNASRKVTVTGEATYTAVFEKSTQVYSGKSIASPYSGSEQTTVYVGTTKI